ncbi:MAG: hypothetical protein HVN35_03580 [Methanobacteriaceae archaeon]|nr:hypothetical protein [Methanobacteriaceae archaeon]
MLVVGFILQGVILNMTHNPGRIPSAFEFRKIREIMGKVGYKNLLLTYLIAFTTFGSLILFLQTYQTGNYCGMGDFTFFSLNHFIEPYLLLFNLRILGSIDLDSGKTILSPEFN